jgi:hypothetical protein
MKLNSSQINMLGSLPLDLVQEFIDVGCAAPEAELLIEIYDEAKAGLLTESEAIERVDDFISMQRGRATWVASVGWGGGIAVGGGDLIQMASEAGNAILAHPAIVASMDMLAAGVAGAALGAGLAFSRRLRRLSPRRAVLRKCARSLVRGVNR